MDQKTAAEYLASLVDGTKRRPDLTRLRAFAKNAGVPFHTVYSWYTEQSVPQWRLDLFKKVRPRKAA